MTHALMTREISNLAIEFAVFRSSQAKIADRLKAPEHFRNLPEIFPNRKHGSLYQLRVSVEKAFIVRVAEQARREKMDLHWKRRQFFMREK
jgi:hypothetical protein